MRQRVVYRIFSEVKGRPLYIVRESYGIAEKGDGRSPETDLAGDR